MTTTFLPAHSIVPRPLASGDAVAIAAPAGIVQPALVYRAAQVMRDHGYDPYVTPHALGRHGIYAGTDQERFEDLRHALIDTTARAVMCARGGYGCVHLLERLDTLPLERDPKWLIGYSDVSALHALMGAHGIASIHGPMCKHLAQADTTDQDVTSLFRLLDGEQVTHQWQPDPMNHKGQATGMLVGGNLAVIAGLVDTKFDVFRPGAILVIEDVAEPVYKVERTLYNLRLSGALARLGGIVVGQFTKYMPQEGGVEMYDMVSRMLADYNIPVSFDAPVGHVDHNVPLLLNAPARLTVDDNGVTLEMGLKRE